MSGGSDALRRAAFEVLEEGMFLFLDDAGPDDPPCEVSFSMQIDEAGAPRGEIGLQVGGEVARTLAANMLGIDVDSVGESEQSSAVAEALNILAGKVLCYALGTEPVFDLHPPVNGGDPHGDVVALATAEGPLVLWYAP